MHHPFKINLKRIKAAHCHYGECWTGEFCMKKIWLIINHLLSCHWFSSSTLIHYSKSNCPVGFVLSCVTVCPINEVWTHSSRSQLLFTCRTCSFISSKFFVGTGRLCGRGGYPLATPPTSFGESGLWMEHSPTVMDSALSSDSPLQLLTMLNPKIGHG